MSEESRAWQNYFAHINASMAVDRRGWTRRQWIDDARRLMSDLDGSVASLLNGHVLAMLDELDGKPDD